MEGGCSSQVGTAGVGLIGLVGMLRLWMKRKSSMSAGNFGALGARFSMALSPARAGCLAVRAALLREPRDGGSQC